MDKLCESKLLNLKTFLTLFKAKLKFFLFDDIVPLIPSLEIIIVPLIFFFIKKNCSIFLFFFIFEIFLNLYSPAI